ncbi:uncharacterized protein CMC5_074460 [Chondromyces crocatus]|uniref:Uncharacterized protein n=1 Tax=Chondromyces crocatus TaxID=52 RepID=A0A0K1EQK8_CHOCO|nr:uncharacterized protein CMC5_074460 [Chondromyces crocatus]
MSDFGQKFVYDRNSSTGARNVHQCPGKPALETPGRCLSG